MSKALENLTKDQLQELIQDSTEALFCNKKKRPCELPEAHYKVFDTHTHLASLPHITAEVALVRAALAGVSTLVIPFDPEADSDKLSSLTPDEWIEEVTSKARSLMQCWLDFELPRYNLGEKPFELMDRVFYTTGVHPYGAKDYLETSAIQERFELWAKGQKNIGIGEIGLDFGPYNEPPEELQVEAFRQQLAFAEAHDMVVELHLRDGKDDTHAHDLALDVLSDFSLKQVDYHCFTSGVEVSRTAAACGYYQAFGGAVTFNNSPYIRDAAMQLNPELMLSETDAPYMTPVPLRGRPCEPAHCVFTVAYLANLLQQEKSRDNAQTWRSLYQNACRFFSLPE